MKDRLIQMYQLMDFLTLFRHWNGRKWKILEWLKRICGTRIIKLLNHGDFQRFMAILNLLKFIMLDIWFLMIKLKPAKLWLICLLINNGADHKFIK